MSPDNTQPENQQPTPAEELPAAQPLSRPAEAAASASQPEQAPAFEQQSPFAASTSVDAAQPIASVPVAQQSLPGDNKKKFILIGAVVAGLAVLGLIAFLVSTLFSAPSKDDYREALSQFNTVSAANSALNLNASNLVRGIASGTDAEFKTNVEAFDDRLAKVKEENEKLGKLKATRHGESGTLYKAFNEKLKAYTSFAEDLKASAVSARPAMMTCSEATRASDASARVAGLKECSEAIGGVSEIPVKPLETYMSVLKTKYAELAGVLESISKISNPYASANYDNYKALRDKTYTIQNDISNASKAYREGVDKLEDEVSPKETAGAFADYIQDQAKS